MYGMINVMRKLQRVRALNFEYVRLVFPCQGSVNLPQYNGSKIVSVSVCVVGNCGVEDQFFNALGGVCMTEGLHGSLAVVTPKRLLVQKAFLDTLGPQIERLEVDVAGQTCPPSYPATGGNYRRTPLIDPVVRTFAR